MNKNMSHHNIFKFVPTTNVYLELK